MNSRSHKLSFAVRPARILVALACILIWGAGVHAQTTLCYKGNDFSSASGNFTTSDAISGCVTLTSTVGQNSTGNYTGDISSFHFTDGAQTFTNLNSTLDLLDFTTKAGAITGWDLLDTSTSGGLVGSFNNGGFSIDLGQSMCHWGSGFTLGNPGVWAAGDPAASPEPPSLILMMGAMLLLGGKWMRSRLTAEKSAA
jgi:hypothetical protein